MFQQSSTGNAMESSLVLTSSTSSTNDTYVMPSMKRACIFPLKEDGKIQDKAKKSLLVHKKARERRKKPHAQSPRKHKKKSRKKSAQNKESHFSKQRHAREKPKGKSTTMLSHHVSKPKPKKEASVPNGLVIKDIPKVPGQLSPVRAMVEKPKIQTTKLLNRLKTHAQGHSSSTKGASKTTKEEGMEDIIYRAPNGDMIPRQVFRVSSEESIEQDALTNDYTMSPRDIKKKAQSIMEKDSVSSCCSEEGEETMSYPISKQKEMSRKEIQEAKLLWLLVGSDARGVRNHQHRVQWNRDRIRRGDSARIGHGRRQKSKSLDRFSSGVVKTLRAINDESDSSSSQKREAFATGMSMSKSEPWDLKKFPGDRDRVCLSPRETNTLMSKDTSERRLCHRVLFSSKGSLFTDKLGKDVYKDVVGICIPEDDVMVIGASLCTFTGNRCTFRDIKDCQVLGNYCKVEGKRNFIRGRACVVSGDGNIIHVDEVCPKNVTETAL